LKRLVLILALLLVSADCYYEFEGVACDNNDITDGYWWYGSWTPGLPTYQSQFLELPHLFSGIAVFYAPYIMEATAEYRGLDLTGFLGGVALPTCSAIGSKVWIKRSNWEGPYLVVDCARRNDLYGVAVIRKEAVEVDFNTAVRWGMVKIKSDYSWTVKKWKVDVLVSRVDPYCINDVPVSLVEWIEPRIEYAPYLDIITTIYEPPSTWRVDGEWITYKNNFYCPVTDEMERR